MMSRATTRRIRFPQTFAVSRLRSALCKSSVLLLAVAMLWLTPKAGAVNLGTPPFITADFNHDGIPDVMIPSLNTSSFILSFGSVPYGTFSAVATNTPFPAGCSSFQSGTLVAGDFNGDGFQDIAFACTGGQNPVDIYVMRGAGDGTFTLLSSMAGLPNIGLTDTNGDGFLDIVTEGFNSNGQPTVYVYPGKGDGTFSAVVVSLLQLSTTYTALTLTDINGDGYADLVLGNFSGQSAYSVNVFGSNRNGTFGTPVNSVYSPNTTAAVGAYPAAADKQILVGNFFGNGFKDLAVVDTGSNPGVFLLKNTSSGTTFSFAPAAKTQYTGLTSAAAGTFVSQFSDVLFYNDSSLQVGVNDGAGNLTAANYTGLSLSAPSVLYAVADANGDTHSDIYVASANASGASIAVNLISGSASATSTAFSLPAGTQPVGATWPGNVNFAGTSASGTQVVNGVATTLALTSSQNPSVSGSNVTLTASISPSSAGQFSPSGTVTFTDGQTVLGTVAVGQGAVASLTTSTLAPGAHTLQAAYSGDTIFAMSTNTLTQQVNQSVPVITWATPAPISYGTALSAAQLNAAAANSGGTTIPGTFVYTPAAGTVLNAGTQTLSVTFTPQDQVTYSTATKTVSIQVNPVAATLNWTPAVSTIVYGTALGAQQLTATATGVGGAVLAGTFTYTPAAGTVLTAGTQTLSVRFVPSDPNYTTATTTTQITVTRATPTVTWATPAAITYGTALSGTQLNATATGVGGAALPGSFVYNPAAGTVPNAGAQTLNVTFTPTDVTNYTTAIKSVVLQVNAQTPTLTWPTPAAISYGTALSATQLNATAANSSGTAIPGTFVYTPVAGTVPNAGTQTLSVTFTPTDQTTYSVASTTTQIVVNPIAPTLTWTPAVATIVYGTPLGAQQLNAVATGVGGASVAGTFVYTPAAGTVLGVGTQALGVVFTSTNPNYTTKSANAQVTVTKATPTVVWTAPAPVAYGAALSGTQLNATATGAGGASLPGTFVYNPAAGTVLAPGVQTLNVTFTPTDITDYTTAVGSVNITITDITFASFTPNTATIGDPNKTITITGTGFAASTVAMVNGTAIATTFVNATTLTAIVPSTNFAIAATLQITLKNPASGTVTPSLPLTVTAPTPNVGLTVPPTAQPGTQPTVSFTITNPYPVPLVATFTLTNAPAGTPAVDDPAVQFATGGRTQVFTIPAGSTAIPTPVMVQVGTVATTISVTLKLTANGVDVTPANVSAPVTILVPNAIPSESTAGLVRSGNVLTVTIHGFSNTREIVQANFHFEPAPGFSLTTQDFTAPVGAAFATWFASAQGQAAGSTFTYAQDFTVSDDASHVGSVQVTLTNKVGVSVVITAQ